MCVQCIAGAMTAGAAATGLRAWVVARAGAWLTPGRKRAITGALVVGGVLAAGVVGPTP
jgi:phage tail sheath protein FI